jgi:hypothetical protein
MLRLAIFWKDRTVVRENFISRRSAKFIILTKFPFAKLYKAIGSAVPLTLQMMVVEW